MILNCLTVRTNKSHLKSENVIYSSTQDINCLNPISLFLFPIYIRGGLLIFLLSCDSLLVIITCFYDGYCLCHLTCCLIFDANRLDSDIELICNDILKVFSTDIKGANVVTHSALLMLVHDFNLTCFSLAWRAYLLRARSLPDG